MNKILSIIDFSKINWFYTSYSERCGVWNGNLIYVYSFVVSMHPLNEKTIKHIHEKHIIKDDIFWFHHNDYLNKNCDRDPCDIYIEITGRKHGQDIFLTEKEYKQNKDDIVEYIKSYLRDKQIDLLLD